MGMEMNDFFFEVVGWLIGWQVGRKREREERVGRGSGKRERDGFENFGPDRRDRWRLERSR